MKLLSIVVPTVPGREAYLEKALDAYTGRTQMRTQIILIHDQPCCGRAWNLGAEKARGDYLHFGADDVEPHEGWDVAATETCDAGGIPSPTLYLPDGTMYWADSWTGDPPPDGHLCAEGSYAPFCTAGQYEKIGPTIDAHYGTDDFFSWRAKIKLGYPMVLRRAYAFTHHAAPAGRGAGMGELERHIHDEEILTQTIRREGGTLPIWG